MSARGVLFPTRSKARPRNPLPPSFPNRRAWYHWMHHGEPPCHWCRGAFTISDPPTIDHVVPKCLGGTLPQGMVLAHQKCNQKRADIPFNTYQRRKTA